MSVDQAVVAYLSKVVGYLVGEMTSNKILTEDKSMQLIDIISSGVNEINQSYSLKKFTLDDVTES